MNVDNIFRVGTRFAEFKKKTFVYVGLRKTIWCILVLCKGKGYWWFTIKHTYVCLTGSLKNGKNEQFKPFWMNEKKIKGQWLWYCLL